MLNEEHVLNLFDNRELRNVFGPKTEDVKCAGEDASQNISIIRGIKYRINRTGYVARLVHVRDANRIFVGKHERKRRLGRTKRMWGGDIKVDIKEI